MPSPNPSIERASPSSSCRSCRTLGVMSETQKPVWVAFPKIPWGSIGWRMGPGEDYWHAWIAWFKAQSAEVRSSYKETWPEPEG